jgi:hypothetical protein
METEQVINKAVTVGTSPIIIMPELYGNVEYIELTVSNQSPAAQTIRFASSDTDLSEGGGMFMAVGGFYSVSRSLGFPVSKKQYIAVASAAGAILYVTARMRMSQ